MGSDSGWTTSRGYVAEYKPRGGRSGREREGRECRGGGGGERGSGICFEEGRREWEDHWGPTGWDRACCTGQDCRDSARQYLLFGAARHRDGQGLRLTEVYLPSKPPQPTSSTTTSSISPSPSSSSSSSTFWICGQGWVRVDRGEAVETNGRGTPRDRVYLKSSATGSPRRKAGKKRKGKV